MTMNDLERYIEAHIAPEDELLRELDRETHLSVVQPRMLSGHMQGRLLEMLVRMLAPKRILEIGTFTGYSAICMARGLPVSGELHTIEVDDELEAIAARYFARSGLGDRIFAHIGSALDLAPALGLFDLIFIDGDKREYPDYYRMAMRTLVRSGSYLLADNILWYGKVTEPAAHNDRHTKSDSGIQRPGCGGRPGRKRHPADPRRAEPDPGQVKRRALPYRMSLIPGSLRFIGTPTTTDAPSNELICGIQEQSVKKGTRPCRENRFPASYRSESIVALLRQSGGKSRGDDRPIRNRAPFYSVAFAFGFANMISYAL